MALPAPGPHTGARCLRLDLMLVLAGPTGTAAADVSLDRVAWYVIASVKAVAELEHAQVHEAENRD